MYRNGWNISLLLLVIVRLAEVARGEVDCIEVRGKQFLNTKTGEPFYIRGVDYQPGGSSDVTEEKDPLSDPKACARDIILFQELGINTVRVYSVNPNLNHDKCMTLLATAGIYLILDVNSPLENQHLNRYQPWTTYNELYLDHVFKVVEQFSRYDNTLGFFAGNEIVNDEQSAKHSPPYIKSVIKDLKKYIKKNSPRKVPVGYSAADDLLYRVPLSLYLECCEDPNEDLSVDFYGVNSYQWCGSQTMETSGYDELLKAYTNFTKPVFFSEFGCNEVLPRQFDEVEALYSEEMCAIFSGGLLYEFTQASNNYGLVDLDADGNIQLLDDFYTLKKQYDGNKMPSNANLEQSDGSGSKQSSRESSENRVAVCQSTYDNIEINGKVAKGLADKLINKGVTVEYGKYVKLSDDDKALKFDIRNPDASEWTGPISIKEINRITASEISQSSGQGSGSGEDRVDARDSKKSMGAAITKDTILLFLILVHMLYIF